MTLQSLRSSGSASASLEQSFADLFLECPPGGAQRIRILVMGRAKALRPAVKEQIHLIGREAVFNALRHSNATSIEVEVEYLSRRLRVAVRDNGCGFDAKVLQSKQASHSGLLGMHDRATSIGADLRIWSRRESGTEVEVSISSDLAVDAHTSL